MADVQIESGYTRIADTLLEALSQAPISGSHLRVMLALVRLTYGYRQKERVIGSKLIEAVCGIDDRRVRRVLGDLVKWGMVRRSEVRPGGRPKLSIVKNFDHWSITESGREGEFTRVHVSPGTREPARVHVDPGTRRPGDPGTRVPDYPGTRVPAATNNSTNNSTESERGASSDPSARAHSEIEDHTRNGGVQTAPARASPLLNLIAKLDGDPDEKLAWLDHELPLIEAEAETGRGTVKTLTIRFYRQYLRGDRTFRGWASKQATEAAKHKWQEQHKADMAELEREEGYVSAHR